MPKVRVTERPLSDHYAVTMGVDSAVTVRWIADNGESESIVLPPDKTANRVLVAVLNWLGPARAYTVHIDPNECVTVSLSNDRWLIVDGLANRILTVVLYDFKHGHDD